jgi:hypothetical protein
MTNNTGEPDDDDDDEGTKESKLAGKYFLIFVVLND